LDSEAGTAAGKEPASSASLRACRLFLEERPCQYDSDVVDMAVSFLTAQMPLQYPFSGSHSSHHSKTAISTTRGDSKCDSKRSVRLRAYQMRGWYGSWMGRE
jgi:hypothetical protein